MNSAAILGFTVWMRGDFAVQMASHGVLPTPAVVSAAEPGACLQAQHAAARFIAFPVLPAAEPGAATQELSAAEA